MVKPIRAIELHYPMIQFLISPFPSCLKPQFQSEAKCQAIYVKMIFHANRTHFYNKVACVAGGILEPGKGAGGGGELRRLTTKVFHLALF